MVKQRWGDGFISFCTGCCWRGYDDGDDDDDDDDGLVFAVVVNYIDEVQEFGPDWLYVIVVFILCFYCQ